MAKLGDIVEKIRSKNAGPFWLTVDIFCGNAGAFNEASSSLKTETVAKIFNVEKTTIKRFDITALNVIKLSFPRPTVQGSLTDRDMHGASFGILLNNLELE